MQQKTGRSVAKQPHSGNKVHVEMLRWLTLRCTYKSPVLLPYMVVASCATHVISWWPSCSAMYQNPHAAQCSR
jgi:hypothetical protein